MTCLARVANVIESIPGVSEVGKIPESFPTVLVVYFDPELASAEAIVQAAKVGLETDPFNPDPVAVTLELAAVQRPARLEAIQRFGATDLWTRSAGGNRLRLDTELFGCGTCLSQVTMALRETPGIVDAGPDFSREGTFLLVAYDPMVINADGVVHVAKRSLEADQLLQTSVAVHVVPE